VVRLWAFGQSKLVSVPPRSILPSPVSRAALGPSSHLHQQNSQLLKECTLLLSYGIMQVPMGRELQVYVGCHCIKLLLNADCNIMQLRCEDMNVLHHVKSSLAQLLTGGSKCKRPVLINRTILSMAQVHCDEISLIQSKRGQEFELQFNIV